MSVFTNIYTTRYEQAAENRAVIKSYSDFNFFDTCMTTVINTFKWSNFPNKDLPPFMIEWFLQNAGRIAMYRNDDGNLAVHPAFPAGGLTDNGTFTSYDIITPNGKTYVRKAEDIALGYNNCFKMPYVYKIDQFAKKMSYSLRAVDSALTKATLPVAALFENPDQLKKFEKYADPETAMQPFVAMLKEKLVAKEVETVSLYDSTKVDVLALWDVYTRYRNLFYTTFGINNVEIQKRERLTEAEGAGNDEITRYSLLSDMYDRRKEWVEKCKEKFGIEISFELNRDLSTVLNIETDNEEKIDLMRMEFTKDINPAAGEQDDQAAEEAADEAATDAADEAEDKAAERGAE